MSDKNKRGDGYKDAADGKEKQSQDQEYQQGYDSRKEAERPLPPLKPKEGE